MRRFCLLLTLLALLPLLPAHAQEDPRAQSEQAYQRGLTAWRAKDWATAEAGYREAVELWEDNAVALNDLAWLLLTCEDVSRRNFKEALPLAERAVALEPDSPSYMDTLATAYDAAGRHLDAARLELKAARKNPQEKFFGEQLRDFGTRALEKLEAERAEAHVLIGHGRLIEANLSPAEASKTIREAALANFDAALVLHDLPAAHAGRGTALFGLGRWKLAADALGKAIDLGDGAPALWRLRGMALSRAGRHAEAAETLETAILMAPADYDSRLAAANAWKAAGHPDRVAGVVRKAAADLPRENPLWGIRWRQQLYGVQAEAYEAALKTSTEPGAKAAARQKALDALVRAQAARATDHTNEARILAHYRALHPEAAADVTPAQIRATLSAEAFDHEPAPTFSEVTSVALPEGTRGRRLAFGDLDGDGDPDLVLGGHRVFRNDGGTFKGVSGTGLKGSTGGGVLADYDRDGDLDLYSISHSEAGDRLYRNDSADGTIRFSDVTGQVGIEGGMTDSHPSEGAAWGDLNGDGYPDLYVANYELPGDQLSRATPDRLYLSDGKGGFTNASDRLKAVTDRCGRGVNMVDFDLDGDVDIYVSNYRLNPNTLWVNDGSANLTDEAEARGVHGVQIRGAFGHTIGSAWGDLDGDGDLDLVAANLAHPRFIDFSDKTMLYLQGADGTFKDVRQRVGLEFEETHSDPTLFDADDDGDLDLFLTSVYPNRPSFLWLNQREDPVDGHLPFSMADVTWVSGLRVFDGWGAASADIDGDGDLDLCVSSGKRVRLFRNDGLSASANRSVRLRLRGTRSDTWGAGATAVLTLGGRSVVRQLSLGHGTTSQSEPILHFGVGQATGPFPVEVRWPSGAVSKTQLEPGLHVVEEPAD